MTSDCNIGRLNVDLHQGQYADFNKFLLYCNVNAFSGKGMKRNGDEKCQSQTENRVPCILRVRNYAGQMLVLRAWTIELARVIMLPTI